LNKFSKLKKLNDCCTKLDIYTTPTGARSHILYFIFGQKLHKEDNNCNTNLFFKTTYLCMFYKKNILG